MQSGSASVYKSICHQTIWGRKYWNNLNLSDYGNNILQRCPAATAGYQLFRQQSLAEGIMKSGNYSMVASFIAFYDRNDVLKDRLKSAGIHDFQTAWGRILEGKAIFKTWTHQEWVAFVQKNQVSGQLDGWLKYLE